MDADTAATLSTLPALFVGGTLIQPLVDALKRAFLPDRWAALTAIAVGALLGVLGGLYPALETETPLLILGTALAGLAAGAMASRNYSAAKAEGIAEATDATPRRRR